ncbi:MULTISPECIES: putative photosynthetic complex assembly protein PuhE [Sphingomonas]|uniref:putative photosynthetic complex assembly protein PuhE n=1 Tax=Sphingomonas TaxID=13687 RepID=UPI00082A908A|nr:putative photosynthetic complex assembly protein PuhE [Sphingomonas sp. CCH10-B3]
MSVPPLLFALAVWFFGTAAVVWLDSRPRETFAGSFRAAGIVAIAALIAIVATAGSQSFVSVYIAFAASIAIWGWHEMGFLMGFVSGPRRDPCPPGARGWARFKAATATVIHHEIALAATVLLLVALCWGQPNQTAPLAFALLFGMRLSAKLNLYLGVPSLSDEVFPAHLAYLKTYFRKARCNWLFPFSVGFGSLATWGAWAAAAATREPGMAASWTLIAGLAFLGVVEHLLLALPIRDAMMYRWASLQPVRAKTMSTEQR